jgi:hypothetical protein
MPPVGRIWDSRAPASGNPTMAMPGRPRRRGLDSTETRCATSAAGDAVRHGPGAGYPPRVTKWRRPPTRPSPPVVSLQPGQAEMAPVPFFFSGESFESDDPDLRVLKSTSAEPIRLAAS